MITRTLHGKARSKQVIWQLVGPIYYYPNSEIIKRNHTAQGNHKSECYVAIQLASQKQAVGAC